MNTERVAGRHRNRLEVEELLRDYAGSGLSRREFCRSRGVGVSTLGHHLKRSRQELAGGQSRQIVAVELCSANSVQRHAVAEQSEPLLDQADSLESGKLPAQVAAEQAQAPGRDPGAVPFLTGA